MDEIGREMTWKNDEMDATDSKWICLFRQKNQKTIGPPVTVRTKARLATLQEPQTWNLLE